MINYRCDACGHWMQSSDHLVGMTLSCRECGEPVAVPAKSLSNVPNASRPSQVARLAALGTGGADDTPDEGPVEAGWNRLQVSASRWLTGSRLGVVIGVAAAMLAALAVAAVLWFRHT
jgi:hypothetical protein